jgi:hypothetical protein
MLGDSTSVALEQLFSTGTALNHQAKSLTLWHEFAQDALEATFERLELRGGLRQAGSHGQAHTDLTDTVLVDHRAIDHLPTWNLVEEVPSLHSDASSLERETERTARGSFSSNGLQTSSRSTA